MFLFTWWPTGGMTIYDIGLYVEQVELVLKLGWYRTGFGINFSE
jgi:hypothetical protein